MKYWTELCNIDWATVCFGQFRVFTYTDCCLWNHLQKIRGWKSATGSNKCNTRWVLLKVARTFNVLSLQTTTLSGFNCCENYQANRIFFQVTVAKYKLLKQLSILSAYNIVSVTFSPVIEIVPSWSFWSTRISFDKVLYILGQVSIMSF